MTILVKYERRLGMLDAGKKKQKKILFNQRKSHYVTTPKKMTEHTSKDQWKGQERKKIKLECISVKYEFQQ